MATSVNRAVPDPVSFWPKPSQPSSLPPSPDPFRSPDVADDSTTTARTPDAAKMHADDCARARKAGKTCVLDMGGEDIESDTPTAGGSAIAVSIRPTYSFTLNVSF